MVEYGEAWLIASCRGLDSSMDMSKNIKSINRIINNSMIFSSLF